MRDSRNSQLVNSASLQEEEQIIEKNDSDQSEEVAQQQEQQTRRIATLLETKEDEATRMALEEVKARERRRADWIKAVMGATVILVPTIILVFFFVTFSLVEPEKKVGSDDAPQV